MEDKKLVAEWMGWVVDVYNLNEEEYPQYFRKSNNDDWVEFSDWNPGDNDKATFKEWEEIYGNMTEKETERMTELIILDSHNFQISPEFHETHIKNWEHYQPSWTEVYDSLSASPEIRWKALLQMIKEGK